MSTSDVSEAKRRLTLPFFDDKRVDVALASNVQPIVEDLPMDARAQDHGTRGKEPASSR